MSAPIDAENGSTVVLGKTVSDLQEGVSIGAGTVYGKLKYNEGWASGPLAGPGYFLAIKVDNSDLEASSIKLGLVPSASGMDPVEIVGDPDMNAVFKIADKDNQVLTVITTKNSTTNTVNYSLNGLQLM